MTDTDRANMGALFREVATKLGGYVPGRGMVFSDCVARALGYYDATLLRAHMRDPNNVEWRRRLIDAVAMLKAARP
ncbi:hypothetical protein QA634_35460 (plasmid) [Methylobacterium sp. CB376]|uniref:hypothetical protein n=1 Tax=unclassified Methylobacterium TaxID=2615210 RepID=UPI0005BC5181|nr:MULTISPECIES: hypothetical protein [Methylobacterium]WFT83774.1 hypothetical protein QA634_35460 [Methylobacterium nodulans]